MATYFFHREHGMTSNDNILWPYLVRQGRYSAHFDLGAAWTGPARRTYGAPKEIPQKLEGVDPRAVFNCAVIVREAAVVSSSDSSRTCVCVLMSLRVRAMYQSVLYGDGIIL